MIAGYCWPQSALPNETVTVFCHSDAREFRADVVRSGLHDRQVERRGPMPAVAQGVPDNVGEHGCRWRPSFEIEIPSDWPSGFYLVSLTDSDGNRAEAFFVVRSRAPLDAMLVLSTATWHAYNAWGGPSFYTGGHTCATQRPMPKGYLYQSEPGRHRIARFTERTRADHQAIADAGYEPWFTNAGWANWEQLFARWAEAEGLQLGYATSEDLDRDRDLLTGYPAYLSVGHDEYWSRGMRDTVEGYVDAGGRAAFFSGNVAFWQARFAADYSQLTSYKMALDADPQNAPDADGLAPDVTTMWSDPLLARPENEMTGVSFTRGGYARVPNAPYGTGGYAVWRPEHWCFESLAMAPGDVLGADGIVVGYECDGCDFTMRQGKPVPTSSDGTPASFEILGTAPAHLWETSEAPGVLGDDFVGELNWVAQRIGGADTADHRRRFTNGHAVLGTFRRGRGEVFTSGCTDWVYGLPHDDVATVTRNIMTRFTRARPAAG